MVSPGRLPVVFSRQESVPRFLNAQTHHIDIRETVRTQTALRAQTEGVGGIFYDTSSTISVPWMNQRQSCIHIEGLFKCSFRLSAAKRPKDILWA